MWLDKSVTRLAKAKDADVYQYVVQSYEDSPDAFVGGPDLKGVKQVTATNAVPEQVRLGPRRARRVQEREGAAAAGRAALSGRVREREEVPDDRLRLREALRLAPQLHRAVRAGVLQRDLVHQRGLLLLRARHRLSPARARLVRRRVRPSRRGRRRADGRDRSEEGRHDRPFVGRLRHGVHGDAYRHVRRRRRGRADHESRQQLRQPSLLVRHRRDRSHRDRPAAHAGAALRGSAGLRRATPPSSPSTR